MATNFPATGSQWIRKNDGVATNIVGRVTTDQPRVVVEDVATGSRATCTVSQFYRHFEPKET